MTDATASLPPKPFPVHPPAEGTPGLENESVSTGDTGQFWSTDEGPSFAEFLDIINPLHHIPVVSTIYRAITGDEIGAGPRFIGGMLFGGPVGALAAGVTALFEEASGGDLGQHLAEMIDDFSGGDDAPATAANTAAALPTAANGQQAALTVPASGTAGAPAGETIGDATAGTLNRIALNPAAALGAAQTMRLGAVQNTGQAMGQALGQNTARTTADTAVLTARQAQQAQHAAIQKQAAALPKATRVFPAHPANTGGTRPMMVPFGGTRPDGVVRAPAAQTIAQPAAGQPEVSAAVSRSRRQQADLMLAQWAAQQMAQQQAAPGGKSGKSGSGNDDDDGPAAQQAAAAHPMLAPRNASPEWYAQAMNKALNQYKAGANALPAGVPALSVTR